VLAFVAMLFIPRGVGEADTGEDLMAESTGFSRG
jgi:hypothetical protein